MKSWISLASICVFLCFFLKTVTALQCYHCNSYTSFADCHSNSEPVQCGWDTRCAKIFFKLPKTNVYRKQCINIAYCKERKRTCSRIADAVDCDVLCCKEDKCNAGSHITSGIISWACALLTVFWVMAMVYRNA
ncbi:predicted protein [Nematostella vectensis]|uniref:Uncharacterized protein n=1 Tax=Nematostella vectensis TaxID=45351 RepID=A7RKX1_NEMVE|nr:predicted protein [Nematostella vectensis]|eukprot:XP_001639819.1 predicted protein [Nematostella vectensis]